MLLLCGQFFSPLIKMIQTDGLWFEKFHMLERPQHYDHKEGVVNEAIFRKNFDILLYLAEDFLCLSLRDV